jgi:DNA polymerase II small subunit/DNA polymerase delta subunit B
MPDADILTTIQVSLERIETKLSERDVTYKEGIAKNSKNLGECFSELRDFKSSIKDDFHALDTSLDGNVKETKALSSKMSHLETTVHDLKISYAKVSFFATLATAVITAVVVKFFAG